MADLWRQLEELKARPWVDLCHVIDDESPYWGGMPEGVVEMGKVAVDWDDGYDLLIQTFKFPGQFGTHIDYPGHFKPGARLLTDFDLKEMVCPLVVLDFSAQAAANCDFELQIADVEAWEGEHGRIPAGAFVAMRTDWYKKWPDNDALANLDADGGEHYPGWSMAVLKWLFDERQIAGVGHETLDTDCAAMSAKAYDETGVVLPCERFVLESGHFQVELLANLDQCPATGAIIVIAAARVRDATGLPVRAWAILPE